MRPASRHTACIQQTESIVHSIRKHGLLQTCASGVRTPDPKTRSDRLLKLLATLATSCWAKLTSDTRNASSGDFDAVLGTVSLIMLATEGVSDSQSLKRGPSWSAHFLGSYMRPASCSVHTLDVFAPYSMQRLSAVSGCLVRASIITIALLKVVMLALAMFNTRSAA